MDAPRPKLNVDEVAAVIDEVGIGHNTGTCSLTKDLMKHRYRNAAGIDNVFQNITGAYTGKLVDIPDKYHTSMAWNRF